MPNPSIILFTTDAIGLDEILTAQTPASMIEIKEDGNGASGSYLIRRTGVTDPQTLVGSGGNFIFRPRLGALKFAVGEIICRVAASIGTLNMVQIED